MMAKHRAAWPSTINYAVPLFINDLDLLVDHLPSEPIDCHVHPVALFALHHKAVLKICSIRRITAGLRDYIDQ